MHKRVFESRGLFQGINGKGVTLIEVMIAMVLLLVGMLAYLGLQMTAIQVNEANKRLIIAKDAAIQEIEAVNLAGYVALSSQANAALTSLGYGTFGNLPANFQMAGIDQTCAAPYNYCVYKPVTITKNISGNANPISYYLTMKLSVILLYPNLQFPVMQKCKMTVFYQSRGLLKQFYYYFFVEQQNP
jgi:prepilin-type N-terminal cleavage/methylation domain-containing protein